MMKDVTWAKKELDIPEHVTDDKLIEWLVVHVKDLRSLLYREQSPQQLELFKQVELQPRTQKVSEVEEETMGKGVPIRVLKSIQTRLLADELAIKMLTAELGSQTGLELQARMRSVIDGLENMIRELVKKP